MWRFFMRVRLSSGCGGAGLIVQMLSVGVEEFSTRDAGLVAKGTLVREVLDVLT